MRTVLVIESEPTLVLLGRILHQDYTVLRTDRLLSLRDIIGVRPDIILLDHYLLGETPARIAFSCALMSLPGRCRWFCYRYILLSRPSL